MSKERQYEKEPLAELLVLIRIALADGERSEADVALLRQLDDQRWTSLHRIAVAQGVGGVALDAVQTLPADMRPERRQLIRWGLTVKSREEIYGRQMAAACRLADALKAEGIDTMVLKGIALSQYYPVPKHRECNDIDLYLYGEHKRGNAVAERLGGKVDNFTRKHDHILFDGFNIDNHVTFLHIYSPTGQALNDAMLHMLEGQPRTPIAATNLIQPPRDFNYVFLLRHAYSHFVIEGIALRHLLDFACFLRHEQAAIDWPKVNVVLKKAGLMKFSQMVLRLVDYYFGLHVSDGKPVPQKLLQHIENDMLHEDHRVVYGKTLSQRIRVTLRNRWKYQTFQEGGFAGFIWDRLFSRKFKG